MRQKKKKISKLCNLFHVFRPYCILFVSVYRLPKCLLSQNVGGRQKKTLVLYLEVYVCDARACVCVERYLKETSWLGCWNQTLLYVIIIIVSKYINIIIVVNNILCYHVSFLKEAFQTCLFFAL